MCVSTGPIRARSHDPDLAPGPNWERLTQVALKGIWDKKIQNVFVLYIYAFQCRNSPEVKSVVSISPKEQPVFSICLY